LKDIIAMGSLFDGIGGFVYAASLYGIKTLWASEIIPAAISVTRRHFPEMEHIGDITKLRGGEIAPVDIITFGSPCQSFSIAGGRKGLDGKSGLFWEAIRIIREMREATNGKYPRYSIFENVPGILSSNRGRDYKTVLEAFTETEVPIPPSGRWTNAGMVRGGRIDLAWVIHDAQYFGVAQRRRRLFAVCDFTGQSAAEILFKPKSLYWYFTQGGEARKGTAPNAPGGFENTSGDCITPCACEPHHAPVAADPNRQVEVYPINTQIATRYISPGKNTGFGIGESNSPAYTLQEAHSHAVAVGISGDVAGTLDASYYKGVGERCGLEREVVLCAATGQSNAEILRDLSATLNCNCEQPIIYMSDVPVTSANAPLGDLSFTLNTVDKHAVAAVFNRQRSDSFRQDDLASTQTARQSKDATNLICQTTPVTARRRYIVRRLTPTECERLQGYGDGWTECGHDGKTLSDTARYQALGNSVAIPCVAYVMSGIADELKSSNKAHRRNA